MGCLVQGWGTHTWSVAQVKALLPRWPRRSACLSHEGLLKPVCPKTDVFFFLIQTQVPHGPAVLAASTQYVV